MDQRTAALETIDQKPCRSWSPRSRMLCDTIRIGDTFVGYIYRKCFDVAAARFFWAGHAFNQVLGGREQWQQHRAAVQAKECKGMAPQSTDLQTTIARARDGQPAAITELYGLYGDAVRRYCYVRLNDLEIAQDCVQEVFLRIWRGIRTFEYRGDVSFTAWMYTIANNVLISHARKHKPIQQVPLTPELNIADVRHADTARTIVDRLSLRDAIGQLTLEQQQVITLKFFVGLSNMEIATALDRTEGAVKALQHRAINRLQHILDREHALMVADIHISEATS